ncbi:MAG: hypothetical protein ABIO39_02305 [Caulobacteraceae bacterium]
MSNLQFTVLAWAALAAHIGALAMALTRRGTASMLALNLAIAAVVLIYLVARPRWMAAPVDGQKLALAAFEILALAGAVLALRGVRFAGAASWAAFGVHAAASVAMVAFVMLFRITRLI